MKTTLTDEEKEKLLHWKKLQYAMCDSAITHYTNRIQELEENRPNLISYVCNVACCTGTALKASIVTAIGGWVVALITDFTVQFINRDEILQARQEYVNGFTNGIYEQYGVTLTPDVNTITQQLMDYSATLSPADMVFWQDMANTLQIKISSIALDYGAVSVTDSLGFMLVGALIPHVVNIGVNALAHMSYKETRKTEIPNLRRKIAHEENQLMIIKQDIEALEKGETPLNIKKPPTF